MADFVPSKDPKILNDTYGDVWKLTYVNVGSGNLLLVIMTCLIGGWSIKLDNNILKYLKSDTRVRIIKESWIHKKMANC